ncbi:MAG: FAD-binding oxidoreductase, partial [Sedimenticola sp.]
QVAVPWAVVGAGFTGLACARRLAELHPQQKILLLEARSVGEGASGRNSGYAVALSHFTGGFDSAMKSEYRRVNRINSTGLDLLRHQVEASAIECGWRENGIFHAAADRRSLDECKAFEHYLTALEIPFTPMERDQLSHQLGTGHYARGLRVHQGALMQPAALVRGLAGALPSNVTLCEQSPVLSIKRGSPSVLRTPNGKVMADKLVLATNYEAPGLGFLRRRLLGSTLSGSFTRQLTGEESDSLGSETSWGLLSLHGGGATVRLTPDQRLCIRNTAEYGGGSLLSEVALLQRRIVHRIAFEKRFPQLIHVPFEFSWSGVEGITGNGTNFFGKMEKNCYLAGGYNGSGVSRGTAFGVALAEYAAGGQSQLISDCLNSAPATWLPPRPLLDIGAWFTVRSRFRGVGEDR